MTPFVIAVSIILNLVTIFWLIVLTLRVNRTKQIEKEYRILHKEIEGLFSSYLTEMREENEHLLEMLKKQNVKEKTPKEKQTNQDERKSDQSIQDTKHKNQPEGLEEVKYPSYRPPHVNGEDLYVQSLTAQAFLLQKQGHDIAEIAQKLNKGRTEIELLLKFRQ